MRLQLLTVTCLFASAAFGIGDGPLPDFLGESDEDTRHVVSLSYEDLQSMQVDHLQLDTAFNLGLIYAGTPYLWGGDSWTEGIDCSHFTRKIFSMAGTSYQTYMQTAQLRDLTSGNGLVSVPFYDIQPGDLLVYGYYDDDGAWHGHVVVMIDPYRREGGFQGLVLGSHGDVGVRYITVAGFPEYFRKPHITLRNVLRLVPSM